MAGIFTDFDSDTLTYEITNDKPGSFSTSVSGDDLTITSVGGIAPANIRVWAVDPSGATSNGAFALDVGLSNRSGYGAPQQVRRFQLPYIGEGETQTFDIADHFYPSSGLTYAASVHSRHTNFIQASITGSTLTIQGLQAIEGAFVNITATNSRGNASVFAEVRVVEQAATPANFRVSAKTATSISYLWDAVTGADTYELRYRQTGTGTWTDRTNLTSLGITASGLLPNTNYEAQVRTVIGSEASLWSDVLRDTTPQRPTAPGGLALTPIFEAIGVTWNAVSGATAYTVRYREAGTTNWSEIGNPTSLGVTIPSLSSNTQYDVQVKVTTAAGDSLWSNIAQCQT